MLATCLGSYQVVPNPLKVPSRFMVEVPLLVASSHTVLEGLMFVKNSGLQTVLQVDPESNSKEFLSELPL